MSDLISRQAVLDTLKGFNIVDIIDYEHGVIYVQAVINAIYNRLNNLPSAELERTAKASRNPQAFFYHCECGYALCCEKNDMNYCPHCGAKLDWSE